MYKIQLNLLYFCKISINTINSLNLVSHANDPLSYHVTRLGETIKEDQPAFCKMIVERSEVTRKSDHDFHPNTFYNFKCECSFLSFIFVLSRKVDMVEIKELYQKMNLRSLADDIREHYTDDVKNILLALIKGKQSCVQVQ